MQDHNDDTAPTKKASKPIPRKRAAVTWESLKADPKNRRTNISRMEFGDGDVTIGAKRGHTGRLFAEILKTAYLQYTKAGRYKKTEVVQSTAKVAVDRGIRFWEPDTTKKTFLRSHDVAAIELRVRRSFHRLNQNLQSDASTTTTSSSVDQINRVLEAASRGHVAGVASLKSSVSLATKDSFAQEFRVPPPPALNMMSTLDTHELKALVSPNEFYAEGSVNKPTAYLSSLKVPGIPASSPYSPTRPILERRGSLFTSADGDFLPFLPVDNSRFAMDPPALTKQHTFFSQPTAAADARKLVAVPTSTVGDDEVEDVSLLPEDEDHVSHRTMPTVVTADTPQALPPLGTTARAQVDLDDGTHPFFQKLRKLRSSMTAVQLEAFAEDFGYMDGFYRELLHIQQQNLVLQARLNRLQREESARKRQRLGVEDDLPEAIQALQNNDVASDKVAAV